MNTYVVIYHDRARKVYGWFCQAEGPVQAEQLFSQHVSVERQVKTVQETRLATIDTFLELYKYREEETTNP